MATNPIESPFVVTLAGGLHPSYVDGSGIEARFNEPTAIAFGPAGDLFVTETASGRLRCIDISGNVTTYGLLGGGPPDYHANSTAFRVEVDFSKLGVHLEDGEGQAESGVEPANSQVVWLASEGLAVSPAGVIVVSDEGDDRIWLAARGRLARWLSGSTYPTIDVARAGTITLLDVDGPRQFSSFADALNAQKWRDGPPHVSRFAHPQGMAYLPDGDLIVADTENGRLRRVRPDGSTDTLPHVFKAPCGVAVGTEGQLYVSDVQSHTISVVLPSGQVEILAGGAVGFEDGRGEAAKFFQPRGLAIDEAGGLWVADTGNHAVRYISPRGEVDTVAGRGEAGATDGPAEQASFNRPWAVVCHPAGGVLVSDRNNHRIRWILPGHRVSLPVGDDGLVYAEELHKGQHLPRCKPLRWLRKWSQLIGREIRAIVKDYPTGRIQIYFRDAFIEIQGMGRWPPPDILPYFKSTKDSSDFYYLPMGFVGKTIATASKEPGEAPLYMTFMDGTDVLLEPYMGGRLKIITSRRKIGLRTSRAGVDDCQA